MSILKRLSPPRTGVVAPPEFADAQARPQARWPFFAKVAASAILVTVILSHAEFAAVWDALRGVEPAWIVLALVLQLFGPALIALRWQGLLAAREIVPGWPYLYVSTLAAGFFRQFLPSIVGGDVVRGYDAWRAGASMGLAFMSLVLDRLFGLLALALLATGGVLFSDQVRSRLPSIELYLVLALVVLVAVIAQLIRPSRLSLRLAAGIRGRLPAPLGKLGKIASALGSYHDAQGVLIRSLVVSLILQVNVVSFYWALAKGLGLPVDYASFFVIAPIAILVMMLPISINGIGVREGIFVFLLAQWDVDAAHAVALAWLEYGILLLFGLLGGGVYAIRRR